MAQEIERKFLLKNDAWRMQASQKTIFKQAYLNSEPARTVRVRVAGSEAFITIKGKTEGISRAEFEYAIPVVDAEMLLALCETPPLEKYRHIVRVGGHIWEIDEFLGVNQGLIVAEIELSAGDEAFPIPEWLGDEVSHNSRYYNSYLSSHPYCSW